MTHASRLEVVCGLALVLAVVALPLAEKLWPYRPQQRLLRRGFWTDFLVYSLLQGYLLGLLVSFLVLFIAPFSRSIAPQAFARLPLFVQIGFFLVSHDLALYWFHRWQHYWPVVWRTHEPHHTNTEIDWVAGSRASPLEILITEAMKYTPIALLGAAPEVALIRGTLDAIWGMYLHSNIDVRMGALQYVINGPEMHRWHHALDPEAQNRNLATKLALWDWWFGTAYWPRDRQPIGYGLAEGEPQGWIAQQMFSLRPLRTRDNGASSA